MNVEHYTTDRIANPYPAGMLPWQVYQGVRNDIVRCCRAFGRVGSMGECPITQDADPPRDWPLGDGGPLDFFVVDDQYNDECYIHIEIGRRSALSEPWLEALMQTLEVHRGWGVAISLVPNGYVLAFAEKLMVNGEAFGNCRTAEDVVAAGQVSMSDQSLGDEVA